MGQHRTREGNGYEEWRESVAAFTLRTNDLVSPLRSWAASALLTCDWDTLCSFHEVLYTFVQELALPPQSLGFPNPLMCPIFADGLHIRLQTLRNETPVEESGSKWLTSIAR